MHSPSSPSLGRTLAVAAGVVAALGAAAWSLVVALRDTVELVRSPGRTSLDELVVAVSAGGALLLLLWVTLGLLASVTATLPGPWGAVARRTSDAIAPAAVRRWAALLLGVAVVSACAPGGAVASEPRPAQVVAEAASRAPAPVWAGPAPVTASTAAAAAAPTPLPTVTVEAPAPEWTPAPVRDLPRVTLTATRPAPQDTREVTVRRGDTLWDLAAAHLSPEATDAEVAVACRRWYDANRHVIGADPDLILPGQILSVPDVTVPAGGPR